MDIKKMKERIAYLESKITEQSVVFAQGYYRALQDKKLALSDVSFVEVADEYKAEMLSKFDEVGNPHPTNI